MASSIILHMDMDAFFASVEQRDDPSLRGQCVIVGGASARGVVAAASYEARKYGVHSAMPIFQARKKCPHLIIVAPRRKRYADLSGRIMKLLETFSPLVEPISIDEAYVDITGCERLQGESRQIARAIKDKIFEQVRLTCSVGVAPNKFLAKIASDLDKPDGLTIITPRQVPDFIQALPIQKVPGVGAKARQILLTMGIKTLGQVRQYPEQMLVRKMGKFGSRLRELAHGRDDSLVTPLSPVKSVSSETTLSADTADRAVLASHLLSQAQSVARQLRRKQVRARSITLIIKTADFRRHTRRRTLVKPVQSADIIYQTALALLDGFSWTGRVRLVGVGASGLQPADLPVQADLFPDEKQARDGKWEKVDQAMDAVANRFGGQAVVRGSLGSSGRERE